MKLWRAFCYSLAGFASAFNTQWSFRFEVGLTVILLPLAWFISNSATDACLLILSWGLVVITELINSAIESTVDRISLEQHPLAKRAKDMASAAVLLAVCVAALCWLFVALS